MQSKACNKCGEVKHLSHFHNDKRREDGKVRTCRSCKATADKKRWSQQEIKQRRQTPEARRKQRDSSLRYKYGITIEEYEQLLDEQGGTCACCPARPVDERCGVLKVDHDHVTGAVRGLLCDKCNVTLGNVYDDPDRLETLANYVRVHKNSPA